MTSRTLRAASHACGIATVGDGADRLTVIVLPKAWSPLDQREQVVTWSWTSDAPLVLHEGQVCVVRSVTTARTVLLDDLLAARVEALPDEDDEEAAKARRWLLEPMRSRTASCARELRSDDAGWIHDVLRMMTLWGVTAQDDDARGARAYDPLLAPLIHRLFVEEVERQLPWLRRGYVEERAWLGAVRGRPDLMLSGAAIAAGSPRIHCTYDAFVEGTELLRLLATALDVVAAGTWLDRWFRDTDARAGLAQSSAIARQDAVRLRQAFATFSPLTVGDARVASRRLRLHGPWRRHWQPALELARDVLHQYGFDRPGSGDDPAVRIWTVRMDGVWEQVLARALESQEGWSVERQGCVEPPWGIDATRSRRVDLVVSRRADTTTDGAPQQWLLDAKYKLAARVLPPDYVNQLYVYGRMYRDRVRDVGLVFVGPHEPGEDARVERVAPVCASRDTAEHPLRLHVLRASFFGRAHLDTADAFTGYVQSLGRALTARLSGDDAP